MLRTEQAFFPAFCGAVMAGAVPVPIYPPFRADQIEEYARRQRIILRNAGARVLITFDQAERVAALIRGQVPSLEAVTTTPQLAAECRHSPRAPLAFLARPARWLWAMHAHHGTISPAPNFAFDLCVRKIADEEIKGLDLTGWRLALNGSEVVSPDTIERFTRRFAPYGFRAEAMCPVYASYLDPIVLMAAIPAEFRFIAKRALADYPLIGTVIRKAEHSTIEKSRMIERLAGAEELARRLQEGELLMVFPEGTFMRSPGLLPFRLGAFRAAVDAGRPIVPVAIRGTRYVLPDGTWLFRHGTIDITIGAPHQPEAQGWPEMVRLRDRALDDIARGSGESAGARPAAS